MHYENSCEMPEGSFFHKQDMLNALAEVVAEIYGATSFVAAVILSVV